MSNQNLNSLTVKILNYTGDKIYHRGVPVNLIGAQGSTGIQGITGAQGIQGITGAQGAKGETSIGGAQGPDRKSVV